MIASLLLAAAAASPSAKAAAPAKPEPAKVEPARAEQGKVETPPVEPSTQAQYDEAAAAHAKGDARAAAVKLNLWLRGAPRTADNYQSAQHLLAQDLQQLGLTHAALVFEEDVVRSRTRPELVPEALSNLRRWSFATPHDEVRLEEEILRATDYGPLPEADHAWVAFVQGSLDLRAGADRWALTRFAELPAGSPEAAQAKLLQAGVKLARSGGGSAGDLADFQAIADDKVATRDVRNEAKISVARLQFEAGDAAAALESYASVELPELDPGRGQIYLEEAWAQYRQKDGSRAMGLLAALDAPSFRGLFLPDKFLLRALIYKDSCQWLSAKRAARALARRYSESLAAIEERRDLTEDPVLSEAALQKGSGKRAATLVAELQLEKERLERLAGRFSEGELYGRLTRLYALEMREAERRRKLELEAGVRHAADELLAAVDQAGLVDYEVSLALYRRGRATVDTQPLKFSSAVPRPGDELYGFDGEYWNDELPDLRFALENRCSAEGGTP
jgi:hypothetical protein